MPRRTRESPLVVARPRLTQSIINAGAAPVTVVQGPAGLGKSTLLEQIVGRVGASRVARIASDDELAAYVERSRGQAGAAPVLVVVDNLTDPDGDSMRAAIGLSYDGGGRLAIATRTPIAAVTTDQLLDGRAHIITTEDLLFTADEVIELAERSDVALTPDETDELYRTTDGWPALVAASLRARQPNASAASRRLPELMDRFVREQIVGDLTEEERELLAFAAVVPFLDPATLGLALGNLDVATDAAGLIDRWTAEGWLIPAIDAGQWRMANPIRQSLLAQLEISHPGGRAHLITEAVQALIESGRTAEALPFVVDPSLERHTASQIVRESGPEALARGQFADHFPAVEALPETMLAADPALLLQIAVSALKNPPDITTFALRLAQAEAALDTTSLNDPLLSYHRLRMLLARCQGNIDEANAVERAGQAYIDAATDRERHAHHLGLAFFTWQTGVSRLAEGDLDAADAAFRSTRTTAAQNGAEWYGANAAALLAYTCFLRGDLAAAHNQADAAAAAARRYGWSSYQFTDHIHLALGLIELEQGRTSGVADTLHDAQASLKRDLEPPAARLAVAWSVLGLMCRATGFAEQATLLCGPHYATNQLPLNNFLTAVARANVHLIQDDPEAALMVLADSTPPPGHAAVLAVARARAYLAMDDPVGACGELGTLGQDAETLPLTIRSDVHALRLECALREGEDGTQLFHQLLAVLQRTGGRRPILLLPNLAEAVASGGLTAPPSMSLDTLGLEIAALRRANNEGLPTLTQREMEVLVALAGPSTLASIAKRMYISANTLKFTSRAIYRKLHAADRHQAATIAGALGLLESKP